jgi:hypothetical protein
MQRGSVGARPPPLPKRSTSTLHTVAPRAMPALLPHACSGGVRRGTHPLPPPSRHLRVRGTSNCATALRAPHASAAFDFRCPVAVAAEPSSAVT